MNDLNDYNQAAYPAASTGNPMVALMMLVVFVALYCYVAYALMTIAKKTNTPHAWMAWVPIANVFLMLMIAKKPLWWFILLLIPLVNIVIAIILWMKIAEAVGKPSWVGVLMIIPLVNLVIPGYLAFSSSAPAMPAAPVQTPPTTPVM